MERYDWVAVYQGKVIKQFPNTNTEEQKFQLVRDEGMPIVFFVGQSGVNLRNGDFLVNGKWLRVGSIEAEPIVPTRLVYFRRNEVNLNSKEKTTWHFVGYEYADGEVRLCIPDNGGTPTICFGKITNHE